MENLRAIIDKFFITDNRWQYFTGGLATTLRVTAGALLIGLLIGVVVSIIRSSHDQINQKELTPPARAVFWVLNTAARLYLTIIRGTPTLVQLLLIYFFFLQNVENKVTTATIAFGINSGAYLAEIFRSGIMSIDKGQMEAGRSLGLSYTKTMRKIILPQAFKNALPALINEIITLLKETSICGYIGLNDLTRGAEIIGGATYDQFVPLLAAALIYLAVVMFFTWIMGIVERRLRESDRR